MARESEQNMTMPADPNTPNPGGNNGGNGPQPTLEPSPQPTPEPTPKQLTQEDFNRALARERKAWEAKAEADKQIALERAKMDETERTKAELEQERQEKATALDRATRAERKAELTGKVSDVNLALKVLEAKHFNEDGSPNLEAITTEYPSLTLQTPQPAIETKKPAPTPVTNPGSGNAAPTPQAALARGDVAGYVAAIEAAKKAS
jgi:hypothetical protein